MKRDDRKKYIAALRNSGRILSLESYQKYNVPRKMGNTLAQIAYYRCVMCRVHKKQGPNIASMIDEVEYGIHEWNDLLWCDYCYEDLLEYIERKRESQLK